MRTELKIKTAVVAAVPLVVMFAITIVAVQHGFERRARNQFLIELSQLGNQSHVLLDD